MLGRVRREASRCQRNFRIGREKSKTPRPSFLLRLGFTHRALPIQIYGRIYASADSAISPAQVWPGTLRRI
jgi:hypothetical protein